MSTANVLVVEDDPSLREALGDTIRLAGYDVLAAADGREALACLDRHDVALVVSDVRMQPMDGAALLRQIKDRRPELPVLLMTAYGSIQDAVAAMRFGAADYLVKPFEAEALVSKINRFLPSGDVSGDEPVAADPQMQELFAVAARVAGSDVTVMITGESGTGKEVVAQYIHRHSRRAAQPFVAINCAAIPDNMLEATLFGYEKGAFTGAYQAMPGKFEQAQGGTLLLDEISEMDLALQAKLLRVLQEREVERLGGRKLIALDVRVLATSNRNLRQEVAAGRFREDLYFRLNVFPLALPALRERPADIVPLAAGLLARQARRAGRVVPQLSADAMLALSQHRWSGNVRELDNVIQRALVYCADDTIEARHLRFEEQETPAAAEPSPAAANASDDNALGENLKSRERRLIIDALREGQGSRKSAAERLGISPRTLRYKLARMREAGIDVPAANEADDA
ncbi:MAG: sigma-54 dependent transcriptional regulator [Gammaproteobacteria bacterium]|nr:sigma-54 dependent transcriptional regulator [Gammaproteobacteria bacterium]